VRTAEGASEKQSSLKARLRNGLTYLLTYLLTKQPLCYETANIIMRSKSNKQHYTQSSLYCFTIAMTDDTMCTITYTDRAMPLAKPYINLKRNEMSMIMHLIYYSIIDIVKN